MTKASGPKKKQDIWLIKHSEKMGPYTVAEIKAAIQDGNVQLSIQASYDGQHWQHLGDLAEFSSLKSEQLPPRPEIYKDPTRFINIKELQEKQNNTPEKIEERKIEKRHDRINLAFSLLTACCVLATGIMIFKNSHVFFNKHESNITKTVHMMKKEPTKISDHRVEIPVVPENTLVDTEVAFQANNGPSAKEINYSRNPATGEVEEVSRDDLWKLEQNQ